MSNGRKSSRMRIVRWRRMMSNGKKRRMMSKQ
jgi:hypothetical protein